MPFFCSRILSRTPLYIQSLYVLSLESVTLPQSFHGFQALATLEQYWSSVLWDVPTWGWCFFMTRLGCGLREDLTAVRRTSYRVPSRVCDIHGRSHWVMPMSSFSEGPGSTYQEIWLFPFQSLFFKSESPSPAHTPGEENYTLNPRQGRIRIYSLECFVRNNRPFFPILFTSVRTHGPFS